MPGFWVVRVVLHSFVFNKAYYLSLSLWVHSHSFSSRLQILFSLQFWLLSFYIFLISEAFCLHLFTSASHLLCRTMGLPVSAVSELPYFSYQHVSILCLHYSFMFSYYHCGILPLVFYQKLLKVSSGLWALCQVFVVCQYFVLDSSWIAS